MEKMLITSCNRAKLSSLMQNHAYTRNSRQIRLKGSLRMDYDRERELRAFDDSKAGVKGLVDAGITKIPRIFHHQNKDREMSSNDNSRFHIPVIDLKGVEGDAALRHEIIQRVSEACEDWGFFQVINHGIPDRVMKDMLEAVQRFHEQETEVKKRYYTRDVTDWFKYNSNFNLFQSKAADWRDTFCCDMAPSPALEELPPICRDIVVEYSQQIMEVGERILALLSEALGLEKDYLKNMGCMDTHSFFGHYYPPCPEPESTLGAANHTDYCFLAILLQDQQGGLQLLHKNEWVDVTPLPGALMINVSDLMQIFTNDRWKSVNHRVVAKRTGPRMSVTYFLRIRDSDESTLYGPITELLSEENPPIYGEHTGKEYFAAFLKNLGDGTHFLSNMKLT